MAFFKIFNFVHREFKQQAVVVPHCIVADRHNLAEHLFRIVGKSDKVICAFGHLLTTVEANKKWHSDNGLLLLSRILLQGAPNEHVEKLIRATDFNISV